MKLRSKLLLSATCLLTISVAATATSAYAWFTANRQASIAISNADVKTDATNLYIKGVGGDALTDGDTVAFADTDNKSHNVTKSVAEGINATDISGDGTRFFKPKLDPNFLTNGMATVVEAVSNSTKDSTYYYHQFKFVFTQSNTAIKTGVYLGNGSTVKSTAKTAINPALRVAFLVGDSVKLMWAPNGCNGQTRYLKDESTTSIKIKKTGETDLTVGNKIGDVSTLSYQTTITEVNDAFKPEDKKASKFLLGELDNNTSTSLTVTVRVWFEGMDSACVTGNEAADVEAALKFYGVNMDI